MFYLDRQKEKGYTLVHEWNTHVLRNIRALLLFREVLRAVLESKIPFLTLSYVYHCSNILTSQLATFVGELLLNDNMEIPVP